MQAVIPDQQMDWGVDPGQTGGAIGDFIENYFDLKDKQDGRWDKFHHCMANCEAAQRGVTGEKVAGDLSDGKERADQTIKGDTDAVCEEDQKANQHGRDYGRNNPGGSCSDGCAGFVP